MKDGCVDLNINGMEILKNTARTFYCVDEKRHVRKWMGFG
jgi:hypothetical protein